MNKKSEQDCNKSSIALNQVKFKRVKTNIFAYVMIFPAMFFFFAFLVFPIFKGIQISLYNYSGFGEMKNYVFLKNYMDVLVDGKFYSSMLTNIKLTFFDVVISISVGFILAYSLYIKSIGWKFFYKALFIPYIMPVTVCAIIWAQIFEVNDGLLNNFFGLIGMESLKGSWLSMPDTAMNSVIIAWVWRSIPLVMLILYTSMLKISEEYFEAARLDGAGELNIISHIIIPQVIPSIVFIIILTIATDFRSFDMLWVLTQGGPAGATEIATTYVYKLAVTLQQYGYANAVAISVFLFLSISVGIIMLLLKLFKVDIQQY